MNTDNEKNVSNENNGAAAEAAAETAEKTTAAETAETAEKAEAAGNAAEETEERGEGEERLSHGEKKKLKKAEARIAELEKAAQAAEAAAKEKDDKYLRLAAEYDNFRRRSQKEKENIYSDAYGDALQQILPVIDNLRLAAKQTGDAEAIRAGVEMVLKQARENFQKIGIEEFGEVGEAFDPNRHTAVLHVEDDQLGENQIAEVFQKGYIRGDKVIRYAVVKVAN